MNFQEQIQSIKKLLNKTKTTITQADGRIYEESSDTRELGLIPKELKERPRVYGFVVDNAPDNIPSEVIERLFIGSQDCTESNILMRNNITHVLSVGISPEVSSINHKYIPCLDLPETFIKPVLKETNIFIKNALNGGDGVLVHCNAGVSRAAMVIIGYLIMEKDFSYFDAYNLVKLKRPCIQPNVGFVKQLKEI